MLAELIKKIRTAHGNDPEQLKVIFTNKKRVIVEAPAGCGKTKTMISMIAYLLAAEKVPFPKKILALTFSVNAAYKIKKDVAEKLPEFLSIAQISPTVLKNRITATNYHGFCRRVLRLYGYLIDSKLKNIDTIKAIDDSNIEMLTRLDIGIELHDAELFSQYNDAIKKYDGNYIDRHSNWYIEGVKSFFLANNYIPFNAILVLTNELFSKYPEILRFFQKLFPIIIVDEFQDTNLLSWRLIKKLIKDETKIVFMGDPLQRIYGFIGALPNLMTHAKKCFDMVTHELATNYRFKDNKHLLLVDRTIRENAKNPRAPHIEEVCYLKVLQGEDQFKEAQIICSLVNDIFDRNGSTKVAILTKQRGYNINKIMETLEKKGLNFFYALFSDDDHDYIKFHLDAIKHFIKLLESKPGVFNRNISNHLFKAMKREYSLQPKEIYRSLLRLLEVFLEVVFKEYSFLDIEEKIDFIRDTFDSYSLKQYLEYVDSNIIVSTVHGAKGLEWDYVIIPDMEQYLFPNWFGLCGECKFKFDNYCIIDWSRINQQDKFEKHFYEELSVFYVAATRAREDIYFTLSDFRFRNDGTEMPSLPSCFLNLKGFVIE